VHAHTVSFLWLIPFLPLLGAAWNGFFGKPLQTRYGNRPISAVACSSVLLSFALSVYAFLRLLGVEPRVFEQTVWQWFRVGDLAVDFAFRVDPLTAVMLLVVTGVSSLIHIYSIGYMAGDKGYYRYFAYLNLFVWAMLTLVMGANLFLLFIGWEGVGLCSYLLIGFWFTDVEKAIAGMKAFIVNRIGDLGFIVGGFALFWGLQRHGVPSLDFYSMRDAAALLNGDTVFGVHLPTFVTLCFFIGATGKSAQIPLYVWLPDAMAGPTPVSALIHAATMVTAGVYMIGRMSYFYDMAPVTLGVVAVVGAVTALFAATIGLVQNDIKKVLAYSTVSQLGYMFLGMGVAAYSAGIFHLMTHAFFKACLFLGAGSVIHGMHHEQDIRKMGGLRSRMPRTYATFLVSTLAIAGIPPLAGFVSKDEILWKAWSSPFGNPYLWLLGAVGALLTAFYMSRLVFLTFWGTSRADEHTQKHIHESPASMTMPLVVLAGLAIVGGWIGWPQALGGGNWFEHFLAPVFERGGGHAAVSATHALAEGLAAGGVHAAEAAAHGGSLEYLLMAGSVLVAVCGIALAHLFYIRRPELPAVLAARYRFTYRLLLHKYWVDELYAATVLRGVKGLSRFLATFDLVVVDGIVNGAGAVTRGVSWLGGAIDRWIVDGAVNGVAWAVRSTGSQARRLQSGVVQNYVLVVFVGVAALVVLMRWLS
jgi:NADH-quinone oxidoreductase subunit L